MKKYQPTGIVPAGIVLLTLVAYGLRVVGSGAPSSPPPADWPSQVSAGGARESPGWFYNKKIIRSAEAGGDIKTPQVALRRIEI